MKMKYLLSTLALTTGICVNAQTVILLNENFNNGFPAAWTRINNDGLTPQAAVSYVNNAWVCVADNDSTSIDDSVAIATSYYTPAGVADDWMITPAITLEGHGNFITWQAKSVDPSYPDGYDVMISNTLPVMDSFYVNNKLFQTDYEVDYWVNRSVSLDTFANQTVYFAFRAKSSDQFLLLLDNIVVYADTTLSTQEIESIPFVQAFPNPSSGQVFMHASEEISVVNVFDISGARVLNHAANSNQTSLDLTALPAGIYFAQVNYRKGKTSVIKLIKT